MGYVDVTNQKEVKIPTRTFNRFLRFWALYYAQIGQKNYLASAPSIEVLQDRVIVYISKIYQDKEAKNLQITFPFKYGPADGQPDFFVKKYILKPFEKLDSSSAKIDNYSFRGDIDDERLIRPLLQWLYEG